MHNTYGFAFQPPSQSCFSAGRRRRGRRLFFFLFSLGIFIFFKNPCIILHLSPGSPWQAECSALQKDNAICLSVLGEPADRPKSLLKGTNPGKPHKAEIGGGVGGVGWVCRVSKDEAIEKRAFEGFCRLAWISSFLTAHPLLTEGQL